MRREKRHSREQYEKRNEEKIKQNKDEKGKWTERERRIESKMIHCRDIGTMQLQF
jgi:hypothetical protein